MTKDAESRIFRYGVDGLISEHFAPVGGVVLFGGAVVLMWWLSQRGALSGDPTLVYFIFGGCFVFFAVLTFFSYRLVRPICVGSEGVRALYHFSSDLLIEWPRIFEN